MEFKVIDSEDYLDEPGIFCAELTGFTMPSDFDAAYIVGPRNTDRRYSFELVANDISGSIIIAYSKNSADYESFKSDILNIIEDLLAHDNLEMIIEILENQPFISEVDTYETSI